MSQFKAGDLALVIGGETFLGQQVEISRWLNPGDEFDAMGKPFRFSPDSGGGGWLVTSGKRASIKYESQLMPLRGDLQPEQQKSREVAGD